MRTLFAMLGFVATLGAAVNLHAQEAPDWFALSFLDLREEVADAAHHGKRVMVYFYQDGCPYCRKLVTRDFRDPKIVKAMQANFVSIAINIWGAREVTSTAGRTLREKAFAMSMGVRFTPTLVFFDEKGAVAHRIEGYVPPEAFLAALAPAYPGAVRTVTAKPTEVSSTLRSAR